MPTTLPMMAKRRGTGAQFRVERAGRLLLVFALALVLLSQACGALAFEAGDVIEGQGYDAKQERVTIQNRDGRFDVFLYGIDLPEDRQPGASSALSALKARVLKKEIGAEILEGDGGDLQALVEGPKGLVNAGLVEDGHAWVSPSCVRDFCEEWRELESEAREKRLGLWSNVNAMPPWEYREARQSAVQRKMDTPGFTRIDDRTLKGQRSLYGRQGAGGQAKLQRIEKTERPSSTRVTKEAARKGGAAARDDSGARGGRPDEEQIEQLGAMERLDRLVEESRAQKGTAR